MTKQNLRILTINDKNEERFLRTKAADFDFEKFTKKEIDELIKKMKTTMLKADGIGLSANQISLDLQMFVAKIPKITNDKKLAKFYAIFNPKIMKFSEKTEIVEEGCLSVPRIYGEVERPENITLKGYNRYGKSLTIKANKLTARVFQHEIDHLNGILFIDKAKNLKKIEQ